MARNTYYTGPESDHFDGLRFFNPGHPTTDRTLGDFWRWKSAGLAEKWPAQVDVIPVTPVSSSQPLRITMVGHVSLLIQVEGLNILTDPVWSQRASPVAFAGPKRVTAPGIRMEDLPPIDVVLISHSHYDHMDSATLKRLESAHRPLFITPLGNDAILRKFISGANVLTGDWGSRFPLSSTSSIIITKAHHWSSRTLSDRRMALWGGFFIETKRGSVWFAGDTGYGNGEIFREIRRLYGPPDVALIPIGAYAPRWFMASQHTDPVEAVQIFKDVGALSALGIHWGTFQLTDEARDAPRDELGLALEQAGIASRDFIAAEPGQQFDFAKAGKNQSQ